MNGCALLDQLVPADEEGTVQITPQRVSYLRQTMQQCVELADCFSLNGLTFKLIIRGFLAVKSLLVFKFILT